ncbi:MAG: hypothetical protein D6800_06670 [Candidatus Zixiibacteriota bacterium]|nr:MAG: hypothetical protein D6800_06670 [candidate division Zixibacteria bacterium]
MDASIRNHTLSTGECHIRYWMNPADAADSTAVPNLSFTELHGVYYYVYPSSLVISHSTTEPDNNKMKEKRLKQLVADLWQLIHLEYEFHFRATGPNFQSVHELFQKFYEQDLKMVDELSEHLHADGIEAPVRLPEIKKFAGLKMPKLQIYSTESCLEAARSVKSTFSIEASKLAEDLDPVLADVVTELARLQHKHLYLIKQALD